MGLFDRARRCRLDHVEREGRAPVLRVALVVEVDLVTGLGDVLQVGARLRDGAVDGGLVLRVQRERLGEAAVLGRVDPSVGHPGDEVVLDRERAVLAGERGRRLAGAREPDDHRHALACVRRDHLGARVQGDAAALVDELVPHPQDPLLRLAEVVGVEDPVHALVEIDEDEPVVGPARRLEVRRVDDHELGLEGVRLLDREPELLLHSGDVRVRGLDVETHGDTKLGLRAEPAVEEDHLLLGDVGVLLVRPLPACSVPTVCARPESGSSVTMNVEGVERASTSVWTFTFPYLVQRAVGIVALRCCSSSAPGFSSTEAAFGSWKAILATRGSYPVSDFGLCRAIAARSYSFPGGGGKARRPHRRRRLRGHARSDRGIRRRRRRRRHLEDPPDPEPLRSGRGRHQRGARERVRGRSREARLRHGQGLRLPRRPGRDRGPLRRGARRRLPARALGRRLLAHGGRADRAAPLRRRRRAAYRLRSGHHRARPRARPLRADDEARHRDVRGVVRLEARRGRRALPGRHLLGLCSTAASSSSAPRP